MGLEVPVPEDYVDPREQRRLLNEAAESAMNDLFEMQIPDRAAEEDLTATFTGRAVDYSWGSPVQTNRVTLSRSGSGRRILTITCKPAEYYGKGHQTLEFSRGTAGNLSICRTETDNTTRHLNDFDGLNDWDIRRLPAVVRHISDRELQLTDLSL